MNKSYSRASSRGLTSFHHKLYTANQKLFLETDQNPQNSILDFLAINSKRQIWLEIGFGYGDFIFKALQLYDKVAVIACDPYRTGAYKLLTKFFNHQQAQSNSCEKITTNNNICPQRLSLIDNNISQIQLSSRLRLFLGDYYHLFEKLPKNSIDKVFTLFPDPWPKSKQKKRRLVGTNFLNSIHTKLSKSGQLIFASDHLDYYKCVKQNSSDSGLFCEASNEILITQIPTKYKSKAIKQDLNFKYLTLSKI